MMFLVNYFQMVNWLSGFFVVGHISGIVVGLNMLFLEFLNMPKLLLESLPLFDNAGSFLGFKSMLEGVQLTFFLHEFLLAHGFLCLQ